MMDQLEGICIICKKNNTEVPGLKPLRPQQWDTIKTAAERRSLLSKDKFLAVTCNIIGSTSYGVTDQYHTDCISSYSAVKRKSEAVPSCSSKETSCDVPIKLTRSTSGVPKSNQKGILVENCIFCSVVYKRGNKSGYEKLNQILTTEKCKKIIFAAKQFPYNNMSRRVLSLGSEDLIAIEARYHSSCEKKFTRETSSVPVAVENTTKSTRRKHDEAFAMLAMFIQCEVVEKKTPKSLGQLHSLYIEEYKAICRNAEADSNTAINYDESYGIQPLVKKIKSRFEDQVVVHKDSNKTGNFVYSSSLSLNEAKAALNNSGMYEEEIRSEAMSVRTEIMNMQQSKMPIPTSIHTLKATAPELPHLTQLFFKTVMNGLSPNLNEDTERKVTAMTSDAVFNTTRGKVRPWKHTALGLGMSSLVGSKTAIKILNRHGHVVSYDENKRLETEIAYSCSTDGKQLPEGLLALPDLSTGTAWDNFDLPVETLDGKMTLHVTVGITYQNFDHQMHSTLSSQETSQSIEHCPRRKFDAPIKAIPTFYDNLKSAKFQFQTPNDHVMDNKELIHAKPLDICWNVQLNHEKIPLFTGYYSQFISDEHPNTVIAYMDPISQSPTRNDVVSETMTRSLNIAEESKQAFYPVSYDLAIASKAYAIQALRTPHFDKLVILLGHFHMDLAFFGAVGTFISDSGLEYYLTECQILAEGSLNGFLKGKFYNRCTRIHQLTAAALEQSLFERYLRSDVDGRFKPMLAEIQAIDNCDLEALSDIVQNQEFVDFACEYEKFFHRAVKGDLGDNSQYWAIYVYLINRLHREVQRSVRTNDVDLYVSILPNLVEIFFALNRPNYARWGALYEDRLRNMEPAALDILRAGAFSTRRTNKSYSRCPIDLTLEQTVNRDASSSATGIKAFANSTTAFRRWCVSLTQRSMAVTEMKTMSGIQSGETPANQMRKTRIERDNKDIRALQKMFRENADPFDIETPRQLVNIASGKVAKNETRVYLLEILTRGEKQRHNFVKECFEDENRFLKKIPQVKVKNFASENVKKNASADKKLAVTEGVRDAFGHLLTMVTDQNDLQTVLSYPITDIPLSIAHPDGVPMKTDKAKLTHCLEKRQVDVLDDTALAGVDGIVWDGGLVYHEVLPRHTISTYGKIATDIIIKICNTKAPEVRFLLDEYVSPSIKDSERFLNRGAEDVTCEFVINGPGQKQKRSGIELLKNGCFKDSFARFLMGEVQKQQYGTIIGNKTVYLSHGGRCLKLENSSAGDGVLVVSEPPELQAKHEEADTLIGYHCYRMKGKTLVRSSDTDVLIILLGLWGKMSVDRSVIMDFGSGNNRRLINVTDIARQLELIQSGLSQAMLPFHALTGCDFTSCFYRKGKAKPLEYLESSPEYVKALLSLCTEHIDVSGITSYICRLYGFKSTNDINEARYQTFLKMSGHKGNSVAKQVKKMNCSSLPPCQKVLQKHLMRSNYVSLLWRNAVEQIPTGRL